MITNKSLNLPETEKKHSEKKLLNNELIIKLENNNFKKYADLVLNCSSRLVFSIQRHLITLEQRRKLKEADFCKFRFCSTCNWRRNININKELLNAFTLIESKQRVSYIFLTLTVKNPKSEYLKETVSEMNKAFQRMSQTVAYKKAILGHFKALEILGDKTPNGEVHPHFHILLIVKDGYFRSLNYIRIEKWSEMWGKALRLQEGDEPIVDIRKIRPKRTKNGKKLTALQSAIFEVAKYSLKHTELTKKKDKDFINIINQTKNMRFFNTGGILKDKINFMKCDNEFIQSKKEIELLWEEIAEEIYEWKDGDFRLKEVKEKIIIIDSNNKESS